MKNKIIVLILMILVSSPKVLALEKKEVKFSKCVDGDTIRVVLNKKEVLVRFLAVDTPETVKSGVEPEPWGKEASNYTCSAVSSAKKLVLEFDPASDKTDRYGRYLAWIYVDDSLLQKELVENGYAKVAYLYNDYAHTKELQDAELLAKKENLGIWGDYKESFWDKILNFLDKILNSIIDLIDKIITVLEKVIID